MGAVGRQLVANGANGANFWGEWGEFLVANGGEWGTILG